MIKNLGLSFGLVVLLGAQSATCGAMADFEPTPTTYKKALKGLEEVADGRFLVRMTGNGFTDKSTLLLYFHRKAKELCGLGNSRIDGLTADLVESSSFTREHSSQNKWTGGQSSQITDTVNLYAVYGFIQCLSGSGNSGDAGNP